MPNVSKSLPTIKFVLYAFAMISLLIGLANLQFGTKVEEVKREGIDLMICLDVSNSMLAEDLSPNRLERSKRAIYQLIQKLHNDRLGIIVFAGDAYFLDGQKGWPVSAGNDVGCFCWCNCCGELWTLPKTSA